MRAGDKMKMFNFIRNCYYLFKKQLILNGKERFLFLWLNELNIDTHSFLTVDCTGFRNNVINMNDRFNCGRLVAKISSSSTIIKSKFDLMGTENILNICVWGGGDSKCLFSFCKWA